MMIRVPRSEELFLLQSIEVEANRRFAEVGINDVVNDVPVSLETFEARRVVGRVWAVYENDLPVGFVVADFVDGCVHIEEMSVLPKHSGQGYGVALLEHVTTWAHSQGMPGITLTTFSEVPWNRPFYERRGFHVLEDHELTPGLIDRRYAEAVRGLDPDRRVCMRYDV